MKQFIRIFTSLVLILALTLSFAACTAEEAGNTAETKDAVKTKETKTEEKKEDTIVGTWETILDMTDLMNLALGAGETDAKIITDFKIPLTYVLNEDGTYETKVKEEDAKKATESLLEDLTAFVKKSLEDAFKAQNLDMTVEEYLQTTGTTMEDLVKDSFGEDPTAELFSGFNGKGTYKVEGNKYFEAEEGEEFNKEQYEIFELKGDKLTFKEIVGVDEEQKEMAEALYPMECTRVK